MSIALITLTLVVGLLVCLAIGMPIGFASGGLAVLILVMKFGTDVVFGNIGTGPLNVLAQRIFGLSTDYVMVSVPLFILMASLLERSRIATDMFNSLSIWTAKTRGGVGVMTAVMAAIMATMSGIIGGEVVLLGLIALPQMLKQGYDEKLSIGIICASGCLGTMIPPSVVLIVYGLVTETSIKALFTASFLPGFLMVGMYIVYVIIRTRLNPSLAPMMENAHQVTMRDKIRALPGLLPPLVIGGAVLGSIYGGITGVTEAAAMGVFMVSALIIARKEWTFALLKGALYQTFKSTGLILWVTFGAAALAGAYTITGGPTFVANAVLGFDLPPMGVIVLMMIIFMIMGCFMDWIGIVLLLMPVFLPVVTRLGYDPVWFGVVFCISMQVSFLSPPFGPAAFYLKSVAPPHISLSTIFRSFMPFIGMQILTLAIVVFMPWVVGLSSH